MRKPGIFCPAAMRYITDHCHKPAKSANQRLRCVGYVVKAKTVDEWLYPNRS